MPRTALIIGAGIGGLSAGIALRRAGWTIRIYERAASPRELGFGLALAPNAIAALRELGVDEPILARGYEPRRAECRRPDGVVVKRAELPPGVLNGPMVIALRSVLHGALLDAVTTEAITLNSSAAGFEPSDDGVRLRLADGSAVEGDLLVGADGFNSIIRRTLHPTEAPPRSCGLIAVRGTTHAAIEHLRGLDAVYYMGPGIESMLVRASETGIYWFLSLARELVPPGVTDPREIMRFMAPSFDETFRSITSATDDLRYDELFDRDVLPSWGAGTQ